MPRASYSALTARAAACTIAFSPPMAWNRRLMDWTICCRWDAGICAIRSKRSVPGGSLERSNLALGINFFAIAGFCSIRSMPKTMSIALLMMGSSARMVSLPESLST